MFAESNYKASKDKVTWGVTLAVLGLFVAIGQQNVRSILAAEGDLKVIGVHALILILFLAIIILAWGFAPRSYSLSQGTLIIKRPFGVVEVGLKEILEARVLEQDELQGLIRTFGVGGLFGYFGKFHSDKHGHMYFYASQRKNQCLIITKENKKIVITPDDLGLLDEIQRGLIGRA